MRMQKEEKIVVILLLMAMSSLAIAAWAFSPNESDLSEGAVSAKEDSQLSLEGMVLEMNPTKSGGHLIIKLDSTTMPVFVPRESGAADVQRRVNIGDRIKVRGQAAEFGGKEELRVSRAADVEVAGS